MKIDLAKRRRVMERSQALGHCICDVRRPCPCDVFRHQRFCPCAGERPDPIEAASVKLTELVHNAGCASKIAPADLEAALSRLPAVSDSAVISGLAAGDDAAIYRMSEDLCLVQTVDVFTPCVDDPRLFGRICAANCLSDIYAMGGEPRTALSILGFPAESLPGEVMSELLAGAMEVFEEAGVALVGGHSIKDEEIKLGFAITGLIDPAVAAALEHPRRGDVLLVTKPLGTGVLTFAQQIGRGDAAGLAAAQTAMATLNREAAEAMKEAGASACTDVTGFGLLGHLYRMVRQDGLTAEVYADALPAFAGVTEALRQGVVPGAIERNREYVGEAIHVAPGVEETWVNLGLDAQTSGGLLMAVPAEGLERLRQSLTRRGVGAFVIGRITDDSDGQIRVVPVDAVERATGPRPGGDARPVVPTVGLLTTETPDSEPHAEGCCADLFASEAMPGSVVETQRAFGAFMRSAQAAGALDERVKELILFSLVVYSQCAPCFDAHFQRARDLGFTREELDEAAWCAIAMGGAPVRVFYQESVERNTR